MTTSSSSIPKTEAWLKEKLIGLGIDVDAFLPYVLAFLGDDAEEDAVVRECSEFLCSLIDADSAGAVAKELVKRWLEENPAAALKKKKRTIEPKKLAMTTTTTTTTAPAPAPAVTTTKTKTKDKKGKTKVKKQVDDGEEAATKEGPNIVLTGDTAYFDRGDCLFTGRGLSLTVEDTLLIASGQLTLVRGRRYGLLGPNGVGKTTLLRALHAVFVAKQARGVHYVGQTDGWTTTQMPRRDWAKSWQNSRATLVRARRKQSCCSTGSDSFASTGLSRSSLAAGGRG
jgi:hypothetical protein